MKSFYWFNKKNVQIFLNVIYILILESLDYKFMYLYLNRKRLSFDKNSIYSMECDELDHVFLSNVINQL